MAAQPIIRMYETYQNAAQTVQELEAAGILRSDISILANHFVDRGTNGMTPDRLKSTGIEDISGADADLLAGLGLFTMPDIGPVVAAGWLASSAAVLAVGPARRGLVAALTDSGLNERRARLYANGVRGGATLVAVRSESVYHASTEPIMHRHTPIDPEVYDITRRYGGSNELSSGGSGTGYQTGAASRVVEAEQSASVGIFRT